MEDFVGRLTPVGWLAVQHVRDVSHSAVDPNNDKASLDVEVMVLWAILRSKVHDQEYFKENWPKQMERLNKLVQAEGAGNLVDEKTGTPLDTSGERLDIRVNQLDILITAAVENGLFDISALPHHNARGATNGVVAR